MPASWLVSLVQVTGQEAAELLRGEEVRIAEGDWLDSLGKLIYLC